MKKAFSFYFKHYFLLYLLFILIPTGQAAKIRGEINGVENGLIIGAILDCNSRVGKEERVAMEIGVQDFNSRNKQKLNLRVKCTRGGPVQAALAARHLVNKNRVQLILGLNSWEETSAVAEVGERLNVPIISFSDSNPPWATDHWSFLVQAVPDTSDQMQAVAAMIQSWEWRRVNVIYEDTGGTSKDVLTHLYGDLEDVGVQTSSLVPLPSFASSEKLRDELGKMKQGQCRVFVVHASSDLSVRLFAKAKEMKMMEKDSVWIVTGQTMSLVHSMNASVISSMQGVLGVRRSFLETGRDFEDFYTKFLEAFHRKYPQERNQEPGIFALQAFDAIRTIGSAIINSGTQDVPRILERIERAEFDGLSGKIHFEGRKLAPTDLFQIINIVGKTSYRELGFWSKESGFSTVINGSEPYSSSMESLGHIFWPGGPWNTPRGWELPTLSKPLRIGVPNGSLTNKFVEIKYNPPTNNYSFSGFSIEVFKKIAKKLKYPLHYEFFPYYGNYTDLVKQVQLKNFDAAVGDIAITSGRYDYAEFTHAHTESGVVMVVPVRSYSNRAWLFVKPFTREMWLLILSVSIYNGFVVWSIERNYCSELRGTPILHQTGTLIWLSFSTVFPLQGEKLHSNLSRMATLVWIFVALIITQSYTANLTSMLTLQKLEPKITNIEELKSENAFIGYSRMSFVKDYMEDALHFNPNRIKNFTKPEEYADALRTGEISAAFLEVPVAKLFVAKYCKSFIIAGPTYKVGGYGFAFPKGSPLLPDVDEALLNVFETGVLKDLEQSLIASEKCVDDVQSDNDTPSLSPRSFFVLFIFTGGTSTLAFAIYHLQRPMKSVENSMSEHRGVWMLMLMVLKKWRNNQRIRFSRKVSDVQTPTDHSSPDASPPWTRRTT